MKLARLVLMALTGYFIGFVLGKCVIANAATKNEQVHINSKNSIAYRGVVTSESINQLQLNIAKLVGDRGDKNYPIYLVLDTPGGEVDAGLQFIEFAKTIQNLRTITIFAASMGSAIVEGLPGSRLITNNGTLMFHRAAGQLSGQFEVGEMETRLEFAKELVRRMEQVSADRMKISLTEFKLKIKDEYWLLAEQAVNAKAADKVVDIACSQELIDSRIEIVVEGFFGTNTFTFSGCPTLRLPIINKKNVVALIGL